MKSSATKTTKLLDLKTEKKKFFKVFQRAIVYQEADANGMVRCISCGKVIPISLADGGHCYKAETNSKIAMCPENVHAQCRYCNRFDEGNRAGYFEGIVNKYGQEYLDRLQNLAKACKGDAEARSNLTARDILMYVEKKWTAYDYRDARRYWEIILRENKWKEQA